MQRIWIVIGSIYGLAAVAMSALAAHGLSRLDPVALHMVQTAIQMQGWHALALLATGLWAPRGGWLADGAGAAFAAGVLMFCGAVYSLAVFNLALGPLAPVGGTTLMIGWALLGASALKSR